MTLNTMIAEMQTMRQRVENSYYELATLRRAIEAAQADRAEVSSDQISKVINNALNNLEPLVKVWTT